MNAEENLGFPDIHQVAVSPLHEAAPHFHQVKACAQRAVTGAQFQSEMQGAYRDLVKVWEKMNAKRFDKIMLKTKTVGAQATPEGIQVQFEGLDGTKSEGTYDLVLQAVGRTPNGKKIAADQAGVAVTDRGFINVDIQMRINVPHKAVHEGHVAAEVIAGELQGNKELAASAFNARVISSVAYTDPEIAWVGLTETEAKAQGIKVKKGALARLAAGRQHGLQARAARRAQAAPRQRRHQAVWLKMVSSKAAKMTADRGEDKNSAANCAGLPSAEIMACR